VHIAWSDNDICTQNAEFGGETALGVNLEIEESGSDGGAGA
jgi:hypothetical protein